MLREHLVSLFHRPIFESWSREDLSVRWHPTATHHDHASRFPLLILLWLDVKVVWIVQQGFLDSGLTHKLDDWFLSLSLILHLTRLLIEGLVWHRIQATNYHMIAGLFFWGIFVERVDYVAVVSVHASIKRKIYYLRLEQIWWSYIFPINTLLAWGDLSVILLQHLVRNITW